MLNVEQGAQWPLTFQRLRSHAKLKFCVSLTATFNTVITKTRQRKRFAASSGHMPSSKLISLTEIAMASRHLILGLTGGRIRTGSCVSLLPWYGEPSGCGWERQHADMKSRCEYIE